MNQWSYKVDSWFYKEPKSEPKRVFSIDKRDRHSLWLLMRSGVNLHTLCDMITGNDYEGVQYAFEIISLNTIKLGKYLNRFHYHVDSVVRPAIPPEIIRRIKNIQKHE